MVNQTKTSGVIMHFDSGPELILIEDLPGIVSGIVSDQLRKKTALAYMRVVKNYISDKKALLPSRFHLAIWFYPCYQRVDQKLVAIRRKVKIAKGVLRQLRRIKDL